MKLIHLSDLHLGKRVNEFSMLEDQQFILKQILDIIDIQQPDGILIAGDVYDKTVPPSEAVTLLDDFLTALIEKHIPVFLIAGNHDSAERVAFGGRIMSKSGVYLSPVYRGELLKIPLTDDYGTVDIFLLPFLKPAHVRHYYPDSTIESYTDALRLILDAAAPNASHRNVLLAHQFVTGAVLCESESVSVGGTDNVSAEVFDNFDYVALGHLHRPQSVSRESIRYCGTPLKYSFSECTDIKSVTVVTLCEKGKLSIDTVPLTPKRDLIKLRGTYDELMARTGKEDLEAYYHITLTDEMDIPQALGRLRTKYRNLMQLQYDNARTRQSGQINALKAIESKTPLQLFSEFYAQQNGQSMTETQSTFIANAIETIWEEH